MKTVVLSVLFFSLCGFYPAKPNLNPALASANEPEPGGSLQQAEEITFSLTPLKENPRHYSLLVTEGEERTISGAFSVAQLQILRTLMNEAEKFAMTAEGVGAKDPLITRFSDKNETAFLVDVEKLGVQSRLYLTLSTEIGRATFEAGRVMRSTRRENGFFFDLLSRLESVLPKLPAQSAR